jgi:hypothetical protein
LALTSLTSGNLSVGIVRSRTQATEFVLLFVVVEGRFYLHLFNTKFNDNLLSGSRAVNMQVDGHIEAESLIFATFCCDYDAMNFRMVYILNPC